MQIVYNYVMEAFQNMMIATTSLQPRNEESVTVRNHKAILQAIEQRDYASAKHAVSASAQSWLNLMQTDNRTK